MDHLLQRMLPVEAQIRRVSACLANTLASPQPYLKSSRGVHLHASCQPVTHRAVWNEAGLILLDPGSHLTLRTKMAGVI